MDHRSEIADGQSGLGGRICTHLVVRFLGHSLPDFPLISPVGVFERLTPSLECPSQFGIILDISNHQTRQFRQGR
jgi:hypothetical protein